MVRLPRSGIQTSAKQTRPLSLGKAPLVHLGAWLSHLHQAGHSAHGHGLEIEPCGIQTAKSSCLLEETRVGASALHRRTAGPDGIGACKKTRVQRQSEGSMQATPRELVAAEFDSECEANDSAPCAPITRLASEYARGKGPIPALKPGPKSPREAVRLTQSTEYK